MLRFTDVFQETDDFDVILFQIYWNIGVPMIISL